MAPHATSRPPIKLFVDILPCFGGLQAERVSAHVDALPGLGIVGLDQRVAKVPSPDCRVLVVEEPGEVPGRGFDAGSRGGRLQPRVEIRVRREGCWSRGERHPEDERGAAASGVRPSTLSTVPRHFLGDTRMKIKAAAGVTWGFVMRQQVSRTRPSAGGRIAGSVAHSWLALQRLPHISTLPPPSRASRVHGGGGSNAIGSALGMRNLSLGQGTVAREDVVELPMPKLIPTMVSVPTTAHHTSARSSLRRYHNTQRDRDRSGDRDS
jgi:hypothetical protein